MYIKGHCFTNLNHFKQQTQFSRDSCALSNDRQYFLVRMCVDNDSFYITIHCFIRVGPISR